MATSVNAQRTCNGWRRSLVRGMSCALAILLGFSSALDVIAQPPAAPPAPAVQPMGGPPPPPPSTEQPANVNPPVPEGAPTPVVSGSPEAVEFESPAEANSGGAVPLTGDAAELPKARPESPKATLIIKQMDVDQVFDRLRQQTGVRVTAEGAAKGQKLDIVARNQPLEDILNSISTPRQWVWVKNDDGSYSVGDQAWYRTSVQSRQVIRRPFQLRYIDAEELDKIIQPILTPEIGASSPDARTNKLIVTDLPDKIALIESIIEEYDVQLFTRVFEIVHANTEEISDRLGEIKSKAAEIIVDPVNRTIIVKDTFEKIKQMEQMVEILDRDQEIRIYNINNIGIDSEVATELIETFITPLVTEDAVVEFNEPTGKLFVKDVRSVHEKILDVLKQIDRPRKQVLIEGEVLSVEMSDQLNFGANWIIADDVRGLQFSDTSTDGSTDGGSSTISGNTSSNGVIFDSGPMPAATIGSDGFRYLNLTKNVQVELQAALSNNNTRTLLRPRLLIANHEEGSFNVTRNEPILQTFFSDGSTNNNGYRSSGQTTVETGLIVEIVPHISNRGLIELETRFENSRPIIVPDIGDGQRGVGTAVESAETFLIIPSGDTRVIGGLIANDEGDSDTGIPVLSRLPWIGWLFGATETSNNQRNLMFFLTPTIVEEQPLNDSIVEPVNEAARIAMAREQMSGLLGPAEDDGTTETVNPIPPQLLPYLELLRPEAQAMPEEGMDGEAPAVDEGPDATDDMPTTGALRGASRVLLNAPPEAGNEEGAGLLTDEAYSDPNEVVMPVVGGAIDAIPGGASGPRGTFGGGERGVGRPARPAGQPTGPPMPGAGNVQPPQMPSMPMQPPTGNAPSAQPTPPPVVPPPTVAPPASPAPPPQGGPPQQ